MLTPVFSCEQTDDFVVVRMKLSAICKALEAVFDISGNQFTFFCRPYYLRLRFTQQLQEGKGERATYELETNMLTVYLPKATEGEVFTQLDNPAYLIATERQRRQLVTVVGSNADDSGVPGAAAPAGEDEEGEEEEYVQSLPTADGSATLADEAAVHYGFADHFSGLFSRLDADVVGEMVELPLPDACPAEQRRQLRSAAEQKDFDEEAVLVAFEDADEEAAEVLRYVPAHVADYQRALQSDGVVCASLPASASVARGRRTGEEEGLEEEEVALTAASRPHETVDLWQGNLAAFKRPLIQELGDATASSPEAPPAAASSSAGVSAPPPPPPLPAGARLAVPLQRPCVRFSEEENTALMRIQPPRLLFQPSSVSVAALTVDLLLSEAYDDLVTGGSGCSESVWNVTKLSPSLAYLDAPSTVYDACVAFARRAMIYPLHRHFGVVQRCYAVVGTRLILGRGYVVRALLRVRTMLSHSEHKHILATLFLDPLIAYWMNVGDVDARLTAIALEMHDHVTRSEPVAVQDESSHVSLSLSSAPAHRILPPLTLLTIGLPLSE